MRFGYGKIVPWVRRQDFGISAIAGPDALELRTPVELHGRKLHDSRRVQRRRGRHGAVHARLSPFASRRCAAPRLPAEPGADRAVLVRMVGALPLREPSCATLARRRGALADHAEVPVDATDRRHHRGADHVATRAAWRHPQLGLPFLLDQGRDADPLRAAQFGLSRGSRGLARVAGARGRRPPGRAPGHLRPCRRAAPDRAGAALAAGLRGQPPGAHRQRRLRAAADRRLRRAHGRHARRAQVRAGDARRCVAGAEGAAGASRPHLGRAGRGHLGGAGAAPPLHPLQADGLGGVRSRDQIGRVLRPVRPDRGMASAARSDPRGHLPQGIRSRQEQLRAVLRQPKGSTRPCC